MTSGLADAGKGGRGSVILLGQGLEGGAELDGGLEALGRGATAQTLTEPNHPAPARRRYRSHACASAASGWHRYGYDKISPSVTRATALYAGSRCHQFV